MIWTLSFYSSVWLHLTFVHSTQEQSDTPQYCGTSAWRALPPPLQYRGARASLRPENPTLSCFPSASAGWDLSIYGYFGTTGQKLQRRLLQSPNSKTWLQESKSVLLNRPKSSSDIWSLTFNLLRQEGISFVFFFLKESRYVGCFLGISRTCKATLTHFLSCRRSPDQAPLTELTQKAGYAWAGNSSDSSHERFGLHPLILVKHY